MFSANCVKRTPYLGAITLLVILAAPSFTEVAFADPYLNAVKYCGHSNYTDINPAGSGWGSTFLKEVPKPKPKHNLVGPPVPKNWHYHKYRLAAIVLAKIVKQQNHYKYCPPS